MSPRSGSSLHLGPSVPVLARGEVVVPSASLNGQGRAHPGLSAGT